MDLSESYWDDRYKTDNTGWDIGHISTPIKTYIDQLTKKDLKILIPGAGNAYEAEYLFHSGFKNVYVIDLSKTALDNIKARVPEFPESQMLHGNFFDLNDHFDLVIEQTFFCAINPELRFKYAEKIHQLLKPNGKLVGLLFDMPLNQTEPPFGGCESDYINYFSPYFNIELSPCYNSITPRHGKEFFIKMTHK
ncbi:methyltransferase domain-containing protein [Aestuariibaculum lutulentum]|uniref:TPMT family class I SAM-dependent methyltransferase n=1 Tax=Aestuariibaculum lutulentum TaxID=2920935 RepID=A0ABS9RHY4_9FLAO|nr:methyltransferase domain-containing protein [Aestuariibaculum lutulentum]MCH4552539.1 TPMT family class I SAM-dependent methyltransferase [Aestuariibaculum lutulentum]